MKYHGEECAVCGGTQRYVVTKECVYCLNDGPSMYQERDWIVRRLEGLIQRLRRLKKPDVPSYVENQIKVIVADARAARRRSKSRA